ncbi:hypothetical protein AG1IA_09032 [Rhizoctonia solani AG-1 IA]|uniref:Uncharacterized protein n=1 Tax=Thanatephorus cucumeris (strain AG1-IA) TaxID=983506 RepID=L8WJE4_THACA|nr:hypothetical protein AG1IA_09032 [Rhizoctonia solani AG-1 IA]
MGLTVSVNHADARFGRGQLQPAPISSRVDELVGYEEGPGASIKVLEIAICLSYGDAPLQPDQGVCTFPCPLSYRVCRMQYYAGNITGQCDHRSRTDGGKNRNETSQPVRRLLYRRRYVSGETESLLGDKGLLAIDRNGVHSIDDIAENHRVVS